MHKVGSSCVCVVHTCPILRMNYYFARTDQVAEVARHKFIVLMHYTNVVRESGTMFVLKALRLNLNM